MTGSPAPNDPENIERARLAFSAQARLFDSYEAANSILRWMREQVHRHEEEFVPSGAAILELNAGTGIDAVYFAQRGCTVHATDQAEGMISELRKKVQSYGLEDRVTFEKRSFTELQGLPEIRFDHVFSNFGGLNCIPDLHPVAIQLPRLLKPGGTVTLVIMARVCPWELLHLISGNARLALRRFARGGTVANVEGISFRTFYFSPREVCRSFGNRFRFVRLRGLASITPPPYQLQLAANHPRLVRLLSGLDERVSEIPPFNRWADHFIITLKFLG